MQRYTFLTYSICYMPAVIHVGIMVENGLDTVWTEAYHVQTSLPTDVASATTLPVFCSRLKTYLFSVSFPA